MNVKNLLAEIDAEIARLQSARAALAVLSGSATAPKRGRPKGSKNVVSSVVGERKPRKMSAEGRKRIAEAQKRRWAEAKKAADGK
ncbi:hypothetical protein SAMN05421819_3989 [Bryocella elongata]|uniref:Uncharacterized protein n=1 Tax=Bryocella elongata TaxID=863522 RepID=A0A1H6BSB5_9BACT|nr:hypothetical protein [Bryocella elongata]SEG63573.1 hypothetical protein SAMN05421819_3989 [Bryocella elongata]